MVPENFPIWRSVTEAFAYCWHHRRLMERYGIIPVILGIALSWALLFFNVSPDEQSVARYVGVFLAFLINMPPAVAWYRTVVYGEDAGRRPIFTFTVLEARMAVWQLLLLVPLIVAAIIVLIPVVAIGYFAKSAWGPLAGYLLAAPVGLLALAWIFYVATRLSLVLAMAALDANPSFGRAWDMSAPIAWRLTAAVLVMMLLLIPIGLVGAGFEKLIEPNAAAPYVGAVLDAVLGLIGLFVMATLFGRVYRARAETETAPMEPPAPL